jgi:hypothetical protein
LTRGAEKSGLRVDPRWNMSDERLRTSTREMRHDTIDPKREVKGMVESVVLCRDSHHFTRETPGNTHLPAVLIKRSDVHAALP